MTARIASFPAALALAALAAGCFQPAATTPPGAGASSSPAVVMATPAAAPTVPGPSPTAAPPWFGPGDDGLKYVEAAKLDALAQEAFVYHVHAFLAVFWNGAPVIVPANVGISTTGVWISPLHTHDQSGKLHIEAPEHAVITLGQFFTEWNVNLGGATVYDGGQPVADGAGLVLRDGQAIAVVFGMPPATIPTTYPFDDAIATPPPGMGTTPTLAPAMPQ